MKHDLIIRNDLSCGKVPPSFMFDYAINEETPRALGSDAVRPSAPPIGSEECILLLSYDGHVRHFNKAAIDALEISDPAMLTDRLWEDLWPSHLKPQVAAAVRAAQSGVTGRFVAPIPTGCGGERWWDVVVSLRSANEYLLSVAFSDITAQRASARRLRWLTTHDDLTGLPNRRLFRENFDQAFDIAQAHDRKLALAIFNIRGLKNVNEKLGRKAGDTLVKIFAERLKSHSCHENAVARLGGDEFALIFQDFPKRANAAQVVEAMITRICKPFLIGSELIECTISSGVAIYPDHGATAADVYRHADSALESPANGDSRA